MTERETSDTAFLAAWKLPPIVAAIATSIVGGFYLGGPGLGMAVGALAAAAILVMAARKPPRRAIVPPSAHDLRRHVLVVLQTPLEQVAADALVAAAGPGPADVFAPEILLVAPCPSRFLDRWTSDVGPARRSAEHSLVLAAAALAAAGVEASARTGDEDLVQTVEDALCSYPATEVVLVDGESALRPSEDPRVADLRSRLAVPISRIANGEVRSSHGIHSVSPAVTQRLSMPSRSTTSPPHPIPRPTPAK